MKSTSTPRLFPMEKFHWTFQEVLYSAFSAIFLVCLISYSDFCLFSFDVNPWSFFALLRVGAAKLLLTCWGVRLISIASGISCRVWDLCIINWDSTCLRVLCPHMKYKFCWYKDHDINGSSPLTAASAVPAMSAHSVTLPSCAPGLGLERSLNCQLPFEMLHILPGYTAHCWDMKSKVTMCIREDGPSASWWHVFIPPLSFLSSRSHCTKPWLADLELTDLCLLLTRPGPFTVCFRL